MKVNIYPITYKLNGLDISANVYTPANYDPGKKYPAIVVAHPNGGLKKQVAYVSNKMTVHENNSTVVIDSKVIGNTQYMAYVIQETSGADIFRIEPMKPYPTNHTTLVNLTTKERDVNAWPAIAKQMENFAQYDTVFICYPI